MCTWETIEDCKGFVVKNCEHLGFNVDMQVCCVNLCMNMCGLLVIASVLRSECNRTLTLLDWWGTCMHVGWVLVNAYGLMKTYCYFMWVTMIVYGLTRTCKYFICVLGSTYGLMKTCMYIVCTCTLNTYGFMKTCGWKHE